MILELFVITEKEITELKVKSSNPLYDMNSAGTK